MKKKTQEDNLNIQKLHRIYSIEIPKCIIELEKSSTLNRLKGVGQNCGNDYLNPKLQEFSYNYSRYDHSVGVALILWHFTRDTKMTIAGLLHDISMPTFSHVIDFFNNDAETQTSTEINTKRYIERSGTIQYVLKKYGLETDDVADYSKYSIADNKSPRLSADRLEYSLYMGTSRGIIDMQTAKKIFNDLIIVKNEDNEDEMCFRSLELAKIFTQVALDNGRFMSGGVSNVANNLLADILRIAIKRGLLKQEEFEKSTENEIIKKLETSPDKIVQKIWQIYKSFDSVFESSKKPNNGSYCVNLKVKRRYINPLCMIGEKPKRFSTIDNKIFQKVEEEKNSNKYYSIDYQLDGR